MEVKESPATQDPQLNNPSQKLIGQAKTEHASATSTSTRLPPKARSTPKGRQPIKRKPSPERAVYGTTPSEQRHGHRLLREHKQPQQYCIATFITTTVAMSQQQDEKQASDVLT
jgi:hypothetical protein